MSTLVVCRSREHCDLVRKAFGIDATYIVFGASTMCAGRPFSKIIVFCPPHYGSELVNAKIKSYIDDDLMTSLDRENDGIIIV
jgi:hypothetical protein